MKKKILNLMAFTAILALVACGGEAKKAESSQESKATESVEEVTEAEVVEEAEKEVVEITLAAQGDDMASISFEPKSLNVPAGSRVKLTFENKSAAAGMFHNFVLVNLGTGQEVATAGIKAGQENGFVPESDDVIAYTEVVEMGNTITYEFDAPAKGSYHYICTYPGHTNMIGRLNVE